MISIFALAIVGFLCGIFNHYRNSERRRAGNSFGAGTGTLLGVASGIILGLVVTNVLPMHNVASKPVELVAMRSADSLNGAFILGTGGISGEQAYLFYKKESDGSMVPGKVWGSNKVHIFEDASLEHTGTWTTVKEEVDSSSRLSFLALTISDRTSIVREEFRVPVGTVRQSFEIK